MFKDLAASRLVSCEILEPWIDSPDRAFGSAAFGAIAFGFEQGLFLIIASNARYGLSDTIGSPISISVYENETWCLRRYQLLDRIAESGRTLHVGKYFSVTCGSSIPQPQVCPVPLYAKLIALDFGSQHYPQIDMVEIKFEDTAPLCVYFSREHDCGLSFVQPDGQCNRVAVVEPPSSTVPQKRSLIYKEFAQRRSTTKGSTGGSGWVF